MLYLACRPKTYKEPSDKLAVKKFGDNNFNVTGEQQPMNSLSSSKSSFLFKKKLPHKITKNNSKKDLHLNNNLSPHEKQLLSHIEDPLWKSVCTEVTDLMGSSPIQKMWDSKLGSYCSEADAMDLCCPTDETAQFINQYSFLILGSLQRYFPAIKTLKTKVEYAN
ncbi:MAG: hypothetical protein K2X02_02715 [Alphaproteobacteria bacterium]|nr:hypothetical protein [Alphaproteobacteria bacterium]